MIDRRFIHPYISQNNTVNIQVGATAKIIQFVDTTDIDVEVLGKIYTLPLDDFLQATENLAEWTSIETVKRKKSFEVSVELL